MDKQLIAKRAQNIITKEDLLSLLNDIKSSELDGKYYPITMCQLNYHSNPQHYRKRYHQFSIPKKSGGQRTICAPNKGLKNIQTWLNIYFQAIYNSSSAATGFTIGKSVADNAKMHIGQNYIFNIDLKDFFPSIKESRVWNRLQLEPFNLTEDVAQMVAGLCCMIKFCDNDKPSYILPQGAPTSPILTNAICDKLDRRLQGLAKRFGLRYSRYADDITFSSMHNVYQDDGPFIAELQRLIKEQGFRINDSKTRLQKKGSRQEVTGLIVSDKINVTRKYVREIRQLLYMWEKYGYSVAYDKFYPHYKAEKGHVKKGEPDPIKVLDGKLMFLKMVKGETDSVYIKLHAKFKRLVDKARDPNMTTEQNVTYIETKSVTVFEKQNNTEVVFAMSQAQYDATGIIVKPSKRLAYFMIGNKKVYVSINKSINNDILPPKERLSISCCRDAHDKQFWLIHRSDKITVPPAPVVDVDALNDELDSLLQL